MANYEVGYKKPPKHTQFKKGKSGNPCGKRKPSANIVTALERTLNALITIRQNGKTCSVTKLDAALDRLVAKATAGDTAAFRLLSSLMQTYHQPAQSPPDSESELQAADEKILQKLFARFGTEERGDSRS